MTARPLALAILVVCAVAGVSVAAPIAPLVLLDGQPLALDAPAMMQGDQIMVWVRDLARIAGGQVYVRSTDGAAVIRRDGAWMAFPVGKARAEAPGRAIALPVPVAAVEGRIMVPLEAACRALGIGCAVEQRPVAEITRRRSLSSRGERLGRISGRVIFNGIGAAGVVLRLVRSDGLTFVRGARAVSGPDGEYEFTGVAPGAYHVYAYIGDNPRYFNRQTKPARVMGNSAVMDDLELGMVIEPVTPKPGGAIAADEAVAFRWSECPGAAEYALTISNEQTGEEIFAVRTSEPSATVPGHLLTSGRTYLWRVTASAGGVFLGATPGAGGERWSFAVR